MSKFRHANETGFAFLLAAFFLSGCPSEGGADDEVGDTGDGGAAELEYGDGGRSACGDDEVPDEDCGVDPGHCSGGDLEGHLSRARPNMNLLPPLVVAEATPELSFRLFGVGSDFQILSASVEVHNGGVVSADGDLLGSTIVSEDLLSPPAPGQDPSVINASVLAPLEIGANFIEIEVAYSGGWTHRLIAAVVRDDGALPPTIFHLASEHGSLGDTALVGQTVTITGFGFGATQMIEGAGVGSVSFGGGAAGQERDAGTVYLWGPNRIVVEVPAGSSERQSGGRGVVVRDAVGLSSASWDFAISPRLLDDPSCEVSFSQFAGEELFAPDLRYTKDADARDFDQDGDVDIFSPVSHATNLTEDLDRLHLNQINGERDFSFTGPLTFNQTATRYNNDDGDGWCGIDDHSPRGQGPAAYESGVADFDNDGDLDILDPHGPQTSACADVGYQSCEESNWIRLSLSHAAESSSFDGDFYFIDESGETDSINGRIYYSGNPVLNEDFMINSVLDDVDIGDIDGDGDLDAILANRTAFESFGTTNVLLINMGGDQGGSLGRFRPQLVGDPLRVSHTIEMVDMDRDGDLDLILAIECTKPSIRQPCDFNELSDTDGVVLLRNDYIVDGARGDGFEDIPFLNQTDTWLDSSGLSVPEGIVAIEVLDIEADGAPDVLLGSYRSTANSRVLRHTGDFDAPLLTVSTFSPGDRVYGLSLGDLNRDGVMDVMIPNLGYKSDSEGEVACNDGTGDTSRCWPQIGIGVGAEFDTSLTDQVTPFWFDAATAAAAADDPTIHELAVTAVFGALDAEVVDFNGDGVLDIYLVTGETRQLNFGGGHHPRSDWDRIYLSTNMCEVAQ